MVDVVNYFRYDMLFPVWGGMRLQAHLCTTHTGGTTLLQAWAVVVCLALGREEGRWVPKAGRERSER